MVQGHTVCDRVPWQVFCGSSATLITVKTLFALILWMCPVDLDYVKPFMGSCSALIFTCGWGISKLKDRKFTSIEDLDPPTLILPVEPLQCNSLSNKQSLVVQLFRSFPFLSKPKWNLRASLLCRSRCGSGFAWEFCSQASQWEWPRVQRKNGDHDIYVYIYVLFWM